MHYAKNNPLYGRLTGVLALGVIAAVACASPTGDSGPGDAAAATSTPATSVSESVDVEAPDPEATPELAVSDVADVQDRQRVAAAAVQLDVDAFAEIKPGGPRNVDPRRFRQLIDRDRIGATVDTVLRDEISVFENEFAVEHGS